MYLPMVEFGCATVAMGFVNNLDLSFHLLSKSARFLAAGD
jgi:hypothetical protein